MALARVQASAKTSAPGYTFVAITLPAAATVGNAIVVCAIFWRGGAQIPSTCTDNRGQTYTLATSQASGSSVAAIYVCPLVTATGAPFTITVNCTTLVGVYWMAQAIEYSGVGTGLTIDRTTGATGTSAAPATGATAALTGTDGLQVAVHGISVAQGSITVVSATPTWTQEFEELPFSSIAGEADARLVTGASGTTPSCSWTDTASGVWAAVLAVFTAGGAAAVETVQPFVWGPL